MYTSFLYLADVQLASSFSAIPQKQCTSRSCFRPSTSFLSTSKSNNENDSTSIDVSDLNITLDDLKKPIPKEMLYETFQLAGYQSTSRIPNVDDKGCYWVENENDLDVTLEIPGLRGQPAASLSVLFSTTTVSITAFGRVVYSVIQMGFSDPDDCSFITEDGEGMMPIVQMNIKKRDVGERWGGFILDVGEDSIL
jgi:hypothetical protein